MRLKVWVGACAILLSSAVIAQEPPKKMEMSAQEKAAMEAMMNAATPGEAHKKLAPMVGTFDAKVKMYGQPGTPPQESAGTSECTWVLGGRWIEERFSGTFMGRPFSGIGYSGYDNIKKQYVGTWMDTMSTSVMISAGGPTGDNTYEFNSSMDDPMSGKPMPVKMKATVIDNDHHTMEMWGPAPGGTMFKMMEITYTRKK
jgi:hypothetical protein